MAIYYNLPLLGPRPIPGATLRVPVMTRRRFTVAYSACRFRFCRYTVYLYTLSRDAAQANDGDAAALCSARSVHAVERRRGLELKDTASGLHLSQDRRPITARSGDILDREGMLRYVSSCFIVLKTNMADDELLVGDRRLQELLAISRTTVWRLRKYKGLPYLKVGGCYRYRWCEILEWAREHPEYAEQIALDLEPRSPPTQSRSSENG